MGFTGNGIIKQVISGDTVVIVGASKSGGPPPEIQITFNGLRAPRVARGPESKEEAFGFASREYLRKLCVGKPVTFKQEYVVDSIGMNFGQVYGGGHSLAQTVVRSGWAAVKMIDPSKGDPIPDDYEELLLLQDTAKNTKLGIWGNDTSVATRVVQWAGTYDANAILETCKGIPQPAVVEQVRDGSSFRCLLTNHNVIINVNLSGVKCNRPNSDVPQPYSSEALLFTEMRMLQRDVLLHVEGLDKTQNFLGTIEHPKGNMSVLLLQAGLAKMVEWSAAVTSRKNQALLRAASQKAKESRLRIWASYSPPVIAGITDFTGVVVEVISGDAIMVSPSAAGGTPIRISLSSTRCPKNNKEVTEPYSIESKEALRQLCIGKLVKVTVEYTKDPPPSMKGPATIRKFATVIVQGKQTKNVAIELMSRGLVECVRHRDDDERSSQYAQLLEAEDYAKSNNKGKWSEKDVGASRMVDLTQDSKKARDFFPFLKRKKLLKGVIQYCLNGGRFTCLIPSENCKVMIVLSGVKVPQPAKVARPGSVARSAEPYSGQAHQFAYSNIMQREVEIQIDGMDSRGGLIANILYKNKGKKHHLGCELLKLGYASVVSYSAEQSQFCDEIFDAELGAKAARIGVWEGYEEPKEQVEEELVPEIVNVRLSEIISADHLFVHAAADSKVDAIKVSMKDFEATVNDGTASSAFEPKKNMMCAVNYDDGEGEGLLWHRAKITSLDRSGSSILANVSLIDYGNSAKVSLTQIKPIEAKYFAIAPAARECVLAFIKCAKLESDEGQDAGHMMQERCWGRDLVAKVHKRDHQGRLVVTLYDPENEVSLNEQLVTYGLAKLKKKVENEFPSAEGPMISKLRQAQSSALKNHYGMFQFGDAGDSDDEDKSFGMNR